MNPILIALNSDAMGAGKSTVASHLVMRHGFRLVKFAAPLKDMTRALLPHLGVPASHVERYVEGDRKEIEIEGFKGLTTRRIMQTLGTEWGRDTIRPDFWTHIVHETVAAHLQAGNSVVIDDMRFANEYDAVQLLGGTALRVWRPGAAVVGGQHASEGELSRVPMGTITNDSTIENLQRLTDRIVERLRANESL